MASLCPFPEELLLLLAPLSVGAPETKFPATLNGARSSESLLEGIEEMEGHDGLRNAELECHAPALPPAPLSRPTESRGLLRSLPAPT